MPDILHSDAMNVIHDNAAGLDVHKMQVTATVRRSRISQHPTYDSVSLDHSHGFQCPVG